MLALCHPNPQQLKAIFVNLAKGRELGKQADFLLGYSFEDHWEEPIELGTGDFKIWLGSECPSKF
ncbi:MAG: hypothetical protein V7K68_10810 [Nostoc sp.]|uniref:hypothetical protein n=1 Tax=Nostoc sp. TaxID=1180 RepID=UPI002FF9C224